MKEYIKEYIGKIDDVINGKVKVDITKLLEIHLIKIRFFQHERLVHFLVTMLFSIMFLITFLFLLNYFIIGVIILDIMFLVLLIAYVFYYYYLENNIQYMYKQFDKLKEMEMTYESK